MTVPAVFVRECLRLRHAPERADAVRAQARALDGKWDGVRAVAKGDRVGPLLYEVATAHHVLPPELVEELRWEYRRTALRNRLLLRELAACVRAFAGARIAVIALKGAALHAPALRRGPSGAAAPLSYPYRWLRGVAALRVGRRR